MSGPAFSAIYGSVGMRLKRHFTFAPAVAAHGIVNGFFMELFK